MYKRAGFEVVGTFIQKTNGSCFEFLKMNYICKMIKTEESPSVFYAEINHTFVIGSFEILEEDVYD